MPRIFTLIFCALMFISNAQSGYQIRIITDRIQADSLFIKAYNIKNKKFTNIISLKFEDNITIKNKVPLDAGIYVVEADSVFLSEFLISDANNQKFTITLLDNNIKIEGSKENSANRAYMEKMIDFDLMMRDLNTEFQKKQQKDLPNSLMQAYIDTFVLKLDLLYTEKKAYQEKVIRENKGLLLASIVECSIEISPPPQEYYRDRVKLFSYFSKHLFDSFTWTDERLLNTPILFNKFKLFAQQLLQLEATISIPIVISVLEASKKNRNLYYSLFDYLEHEFGSTKSPYRNELLYIAMLKDVLDFTDLEEVRRLRYEYELNLISKNQPGDQAIDFNILLADGDSTNLYAIEADILIIYFQNPDCPTCGEFREKMKNMEVLYYAISSGKIKVLTIYFEKNEDLWRNYLKAGAYKSWMHGWNYDLEISEKHLYDVRIIPTIMVLDKDKKVIEKDLFPNELEEWLKGL